MVLTEAFASGTPVVASDIAGYRDVVRAGVDGVLVPPAQPVELAETLHALALRPRAARRLMSAAARERAERFAWPRVAEEVEQAYEDAIAVGQPATRLARAAVRAGAPARRPAARASPARKLPSLEPALSAAPVAAAPCATRAGSPPWPPPARPPGSAGWRSSGSGSTRSAGR